MINQPKAID